MTGQRTQLGQQVGLGGVAEHRLDIFRQAVQGLALEQCGQAVRGQVGWYQGVLRQNIAFMDEYRADDGIASEWRQEKHMENH